jgi:hypothetical protein
MQTLFLEFGQCSVSWLQHSQVKNGFRFCWLAVDYVVGIAVYI